MAYFRVLQRTPQLINSQIHRAQPFSRTAALGVKEIIVEKKNGVLDISAEIKPSPRESTLIKELKQPKNNGECSSTKFCPKCTLGLDIKHTDVLILSQYLRSDGTMMPRRITGLCATQQRNIGTMVLMARHSGLLALPAQLASKKRRISFGYKQLNHYFDEKTIYYGGKKINV